MPRLLKHHGIWLLAWLLGALVGAGLLARAELLRLHDAFDTDARIVHRLLSQQAVQHDAILQTLFLLGSADTSGNPEQRLPLVYPHILSVQRSEASQPWPDPVLQSAQDRSRRADHAVLVDADFSHQQYRVLLAGQANSYALTIDALRMVPWIDWPMDTTTSPVQVALTQGTQTLVLQAGALGAATTQGWNFLAHKTLASPSQPFDVVSQQHVSPAALPWALMAAVAVGWAALLAAARALILQSQNRRRAEARLRMGQLTRLNTLGELAAGMAHELNQPLTAILATSQAAQRLLQDDPMEPADVQHALQQTVQQARRAADVLGRLRRSVERPGLASETHALNPLTWVRKALDLLAPELQRAHITPQVQCLGAPFDVVADAVALEQILHNLLTNAIHALEQVPVPRRALTLVLERRADLGYLTVRDTGPGIAADALPHVFEPFFTTRKDGLGLGLSLCETLAASMGGTLTARAAQPHGTELCLTLALKPAQDSLA